MTSFSRNDPNRRGAALIIVLVLLAFIGVIASLTLPQILRDRQTVRMELVRQQVQYLLDDAFRRAEAQRQSDSEFSGGTFVLGSDHQPFDGTFQVATNYQDDRLNVEVEYRNGKGKVLGVWKRNESLSSTKME